MAKNILSEAYAAGFVGDPRIAPGKSAPIGSLLPRLGTLELYQKSGNNDTDWVLYAGAGIGTYQTVVATNEITTMSLTQVVVTSMILTVNITGTYLCLYNGIGHNSNTTGYVFFSFFVDGILTPSSERHLQSNNDKAAVLIQPIVLTSGQVLD